MKTRPRGAPRGNRNAWKHGFYSAAFKAHERRILTRLSPADLAAEIELIRVANRRFLEALNLHAEPLDVNTQLAAIRAVNLSAHCITTLIRAQALTLLADDPSSLDSLADQLTASTPELSPPDDSLPSPDLDPTSSSDVVVGT